MIYLGSDHGGFKLKEALKQSLTRARIRFVDCGATSLDPHDDYPYYARAVARAVANGRSHRGIVLCRSGVGVEIVANKIRGIRATVAEDVWIATRARRDDNANVLALPADRLTRARAWSIVKAWLATDYRAAKRDVRRLKQLSRIDHGTR